MPSRVFTDQQEARIRLEYEEGFSSPTLARRYNVTYHTILAAVERAGGERRPCGHVRTVGRYTRSRQGYLLVTVASDDPYVVMAYRGLRVPEHRLVMARALGRPLERGEHVHHINGNPADNRLANLELRQGAHGSGIRIVCLDCGSHNVRPVPLSNMPHYGTEAGEETS